MTSTACIYTRISSDKDKDTDTEGQGVARQEQDCHALAERLGWTVSRVFSDNDLSAYSGKTRPGFEAMLDGIKRGEFDGLICWNTDRLIRRMDDLERLIDACDSAAVTIKSVTSGELDVSTANGKMLARILGSVSRQESEHKAERQKRANIQRAEAGGWWSSHRVFGYNTDHTIREDEAKWIRQAAADVLAGVSIRAIARQWNEAEVPSVRGGKWTPLRLPRVLMNPRYAALRTYHGKVVGPGDWPAILDLDTHHGVVAVLSDKTRKTGTVRYERKYLGSFRFRCGKCGAPLQHTIAKHADGRTFQKYKCRDSAHLARSQPELDAHVEAIALAWMRDETRIAKILATAKKDGDCDPDELRTRRAALAAQKDELATLFTDGVLDGPAVRRESAKLQTKIAAIDSSLAELARRSPLSELLSEGLETLEARWADLTPDLKGKVIDEMFTVWVMPTARGRWFNPDAIEFREPSA